MPPFRIVIAGGGPAAVEAVLTLSDLAPGAEIIVVAPNEDLVYRPLSVVEPFARHGVRRYALCELAAAGAEVVRDTVAEVDPAERRVGLGSGRRMRYDALLIATGVRQRPAAEHVTTFTGVESVEQVHGLIQDVEMGYTRSVAFFAPADAGWTLPLYELALQLGERARDMEVAPDLRIVSAETRPLEVFGLAPSDFTEALLTEAGVAFVSGAGVPDAERVIALGVPEAPAIPGLPEGFLAVDDFGAVEGVPGVWAAGDVTARHLKQGGLATQQAGVAAEAIAAVATGREPTEPYLPVLRAMLIAGRRMCFFRRRLDGLDPGLASHRALWWPPSKIAGRRLAPFLEALDTREDVVTVERRMAERRGRIRAVISPQARGALS